MVPGQSLSSPPSLTLDAFGALLESKLDSMLDSKLSVMEISIVQRVTTSIKQEFSAAIRKIKEEFTETTDFLQAEQSDLKMKLEEANKKIQMLEGDKLKLDHDVLALGKRLNTLEKASRSCNVEIHAVPEKRGENVVALIKNLSVAVGLPISDTDICAVRRIAKLNPSSSRPRNILLTLPSSRHCDNLIAAFKNFNKKKPDDRLNTSHIGFPGQADKIFIVEHMSPDMKYLHAAARRVASEKHYKYVWVKFGRVYMKKGDGINDVAIYVKDISFLNQLP